MVKIRAINTTLSTLADVEMTYSFSLRRYVPAKNLRPLAPSIF